MKFQSDDLGKRAHILSKIARKPCR